MLLHVAAVAAVVNIAVIELESFRSSLSEEDPDVTAPLAIEVNEINCASAFGGIEVDTAMQARRIEFAVESILEIDETSKS